MLDKDASTFTKRHFFTQLNSVETQATWQTMTKVYVLNCSQPDLQVTILERAIHEEGVTNSDGNWESTVDIKFNPYAVELRNLWK